MAVITIGANDYDAYSDVATATVYFGARIDSQEWTDATADEKGIALVSSTRMLDRWTWTGEQTVSGQPLEFPRTGLADKYGTVVTSAAYPAQIITACQELALSLLKDAAVQTQGGRQVKSLRAENVAVVFAGTDTSKKLPPIVGELVNQFLLWSSAGEAYGTDEASSFDDDAQKSELSEGYK